MDEELRMMRWGSGWLVGAALALVLAAASTARAQGGEDAEARALFQAGQVAFTEGRFERALDYFQQSYELSHRAELLYNIGSAADRLRRDDVALDAFQRYLGALPDAANRAEVEGRIAVLRRSVASTTTTTATTTQPTEGQPTEGQPTETRPDASTTTTTTTATTTDTTPTDGDEAAHPVQPTDSDPGVAPWVVLGAGLAVAVAGAICVGLAAADVSSVENAPAGSSWSSVSDAYSRSEPLSIAGFVMIGVGAAAAGAGLGWGIAGSGGGGETRVTLVPGGVVVTGRF